MEQILTKILEAWSTYGLGLIVMGYLFLGLALRIFPRSKIREPRNTISWIGCYVFFSIFLCPFLIQTGLYAAGELLFTFPNMGYIAFLLIGSYVLFAIGYGYSLYCILVFKKNAIRLTKIYLFTLPIFSSFTPLIFWILCSNMTGVSFSMEDYTAVLQGDPGNFFLNRVVWSAIWLLYFTLSTGIKKIWTVDTVHSLSSPHK